MWTAFRELVVQRLQTDDHPFLGGVPMHFTSVNPAGERITWSCRFHCQISIHSRGKLPIKRKSYRS
jgi:hypothetical protein